MKMPAKLFFYYFWWKMHLWDCQFLAYFLAIYERQSTIWNYFFLSFLLLSKCARKVGILSQNKQFILYLSFYFLPVCSITGQIWEIFTSFFAWHWTWGTNCVERTVAVSIFVSIHRWHVGFGACIVHLAV